MKRKFNTHIIEIFAEITYFTRMKNFDVNSVLEFFCNPACG